MSIIRLTLLALLACVPLLAQAAPYQLTTAWPVNVGPLNPHLYTPNQMFAQSMVYEPLVKYQADGSVQPWLATRWRHSADGKTWWFTLRDDVAFSNGEPFNAQAAAANFQAVLANRQRHAWLELANQITDVRALSATELQITLKSAYAPLLQELALPRPFRFIAPSQFIDGGTARGIKAPIGTGPWRLASSQLNQRDVLVRNERYWGRKPALQQITIKVIPDATSRAVAFETGEIDMLYGDEGLLPLDTFERFRHHPGYVARLSAPAEDKTAAPEKQKKAAEAAAKAEKAARSTTGTAARRSGTAGSDLSGLTAVWQSVLESLRSAWADFWAYLQEFFAPFAAAWQTVWQGLSAAAAGVWEQLCAALSTVVQPALALLDTVWQGLWAGMEQAWAAYGQPILDGLAQGWQNVVGIVSALWSEVLQPVLVQLFDLLGALWTAHLQPLWNELTACLGAVTTLLLTLWNTVLAPFVQWLITALAPVAVQVFAALGTAVTGAAGIIADGITIALAVLRGMADFLTAVLRGEWDAAWAAMAATVSTVWGRIVSIVQTAVSTVLGVVRSMVAAIAAAINGLLSAIGHAKSMAGSVLGGAGKLVSSQSALPGLGYAASVPVPALAQGAVIPPNRQFLAMLGDQTTGTNVEAPLATIKQAMAETLAGWQGSADGQPINIYIGEELLDSVIANSQNRRALRSGGR